MYLVPQRSADIAKHVAVPLMDRFGIAADTDPDLFMCSLYHRLFVTQEAGESQVVTENGAVELSLPVSVGEGIER